MQLNELLATPPETIVPKNVNLSGDVKFHRLLRIEGSAQGQLIAPAEASLIICNEGKFVGNIIGIGLVYIDGKVEGEIRVAKLMLGPNASVHGDIHCQKLYVMGSASIEGNLNVCPDLELPAGSEKSIVDQIPSSPASKSSNPAV